MAPRRGIAAPLIPQFTVGAEWNNRQLHHRSRLLAQAAGQVIAVAVKQLLDRVAHRARSADDGVPTLQGREQRLPKLIHWPGAGDGMGDPTEAVATLTEGAARPGEPLYSWVGQKDTSDVGEGLMIGLCKGARVRLR